MRLICVAITQKSVCQTKGTLLSAQSRIVVCAKPQTFGDGKARVRLIFSQNKTFTKRHKTETYLRQSGEIKIRSKKL